MEVGRVLHMNGGSGGTSYANNSLLQRKVISLTKPIMEEAITSLYTTILPPKLVIADLGCASGTNTLFLVSELIETIDNMCKWRGLEKPEYQVFLNDLPGNDFNSLFKSLPDFLRKLKRQMDEPMSQMFFAGVPGSFYNRLFPCKSLHFVHSSYSLQWLSRVPKRIESNKGNIYMTRTSPPSVLKAYHEQFQYDFSMFLKHRAEEVVPHGRMVLTFLGRKNEDPSSKECCHIWELLAIALNDMFLEGLIKEADLNSFNIPQYTPSRKEVEFEVQREGSFLINHLESTEVSWQACESEFESSDGGYSVAKCMRAVAEPLLVGHFGKEIIEEVFTRYRVIIADHMSKEKLQFINVTVSLVRKA